jgi:hypothetical protein
MMAKVRRLRTRADLLKADRAQQLRDLLLAHSDGLPKRLIGELLLALDRNTEADDGDWGFVMLWADKFDAVCEWLETESDFPRMAPRLFRKLLKFLNPADQQILLTREEMAELVEAHPQHVSTVMNELLFIGAVRRERVRVPGLRGPGVVQWYLNPTIGTHLRKKARQRAQAEASELKPDPKPTRKKRKLEPVD